MIPSIYVRDGQTLHLFDAGRAWRFDVDDPRLRQVRANVSGVLKAPLTGRVAAVHVTTGDTVSQGQPLVVMEAMKMEHIVTAPFDGTVGKISVAQNDQVRSGTLLMTVTAPA